MRWRGDRLEELRARAGHSRADLAAEMRRVSAGRIRTNERGIHGWERGEGKRGPGGETVACLTQIYGVDVDFFYEQGGDDEVDEEAALPSLDRALQAEVKRQVERRLRELGVK